MNSSDKVIKGQCHCGACSYEYTGEVVKSSYCDCNACQKATGGLKIPFVSLLTSAFTMKSGELKKFNDPKGDKCDEHGEFYYCSKCSSPIYWKGFKGAELDILAGTLDDKEVFKPKE